MPTNNLKLPERLFRQGAFVRAQEGAEEDLLELSFSSDSPIRTYWGVEILGHEAGEIDLEFIGSGRAPLLIDHRASVDNQVGVIERVEVKNGKGRAFVRFGKTERAQEIKSRVLDGELTNVSVGYQIHKARLEEENDDDLDVYRVTRWTPHEISIVSVPADPSVGVGRSQFEGAVVSIALERKAAAMPAPLENTNNGPSEEELAQIRSETAANEATRIREIEATAASWNCRDLAADAIRSGLSAGEFSSKVLLQMGERGQEKISGAADIGLTGKERKKFSFVRALNALANPHNKEYVEAAKFEYECSDEAARKRGKSAGGLLVPADVMRANVLGQTRNLNTGTIASGGALVSEDLIAGSFIELLRKRAVVMNMGAHMLNDLQGDLLIPRMVGGATAYWVGEGDDVTKSAAAFDQVALTPKTLGAFTDYSRKLLIQSSLDVEALVRDDLAKVIGLEINRAALHSDGSGNAAKGIAATTGINSTTFAASAPTFTEVVEMESSVASDDADIGALGYVLNAEMRGALKTTEKAAGTAQFIWERGNTVNGYNAGISNQVLNSNAFFGNWADLLIAIWTGVDLTIDPFTQATSSTVRVVAMQDVDFATRHPQSFCHSFQA
ncbi:Phage capsid family protein [Pseudovibrio axinellae]|uniref:Phage capsid family protein n=1 Tax=Pseudovibrio axinellae TaxID=989403 RepID=A0A166AHQ0_9HYPH|nr:phage major capsid protein [Pseudovibrio axinellae]KZL21126.1 Phage capsid family protein [Pseudovibrio axinellae]SEQ88558.1 phage prohead protease, HK97 family/phage major capsid protein, HK97 family,TIGR01554 [Pseudovibrio axinellae]